MTAYQILQQQQPLVAILCQLGTNYPATWMEALQWQVQNTGLLQVSYSQQPIQVTNVMLAVNVSIPLPLSSKFALPHFDSVCLSPSTQAVLMWTIAADLTNATIQSGMTNYLQVSLQAYMSSMELQHAISATDD